MAANILHFIQKEYTGTLGYELPDNEASALKIIDPLMLKKTDPLNAQ